MKLPVVGAVSVSKLGGYAATYATIGLGVAVVDALMVPTPGTFIASLNFKRVIDWPAHLLGKFKGSTP